ncbi:MAG: hypothetical protein KIH63_002300 [Candidatus Saccharibacteria bacterium]|nr:hypothetical protein [Candidatus Saccharibacteria bacterium]
MRRFSWARLGLVARGFAVVGSLVTLAGGIGFAALQSPTASLTNNTIQSASADLRIGTSATSFAASRSGFDFTAIVPGGNAQPTDGHAMWLKNYGTANLAVRVSIGSTPINTAAVDLSHVWLVITRQGGGVPQTMTVQSLVDAYPTGLSLTDTLAAGEIAEYKLQVKMDDAAFSGAGAEISDIDLIFSASAAN